MIRLVGKRGKGSVESQLDEAAKGVDFIRVDCTSHNPDPVMREGLSPFYLGPVECFDGLVAEKFENAWQFSKVPKKWGSFDEKGANDPVYAPLRTTPFVDADGEPNAAYFKWRDTGFADPAAHRFPLGGAGKLWHYSYWKVDGEYKHLGYISARKYIYIPLYAKAVVKTAAYRRLVALRDSGKNLLLFDFDGYNRHLPRYNFTYNDVIHCPLLKMGHGFVLSMLLEGAIKVDESGNVTYAPGLFDPPQRTYGRELRQLSDDQKKTRGAATAGVTVEEWDALSVAERKLLKAAAGRERCKARGIARAAWKRLPLAEKLRVARAEIGRLS